MPPLKTTQVVVVVVVTFFNHNFVNCRKAHSIGSLIPLPLNDSECQNEIFRMAKQMVKERQDITGLNCIKGASGKVIVCVCVCQLQSYIN